MTKLRIRVVVAALVLVALWALLASVGAVMVVTTLRNVRFGTPLQLEGAIHMLGVAMGVATVWGVAAIVVLVLMRRRRRDVVEFRRLVRRGVLVIVLSVTLPALLVGWWLLESHLEVHDAQESAMRCRLPAWTGESAIQPRMPGGSPRVVCAGIATTSFAASRSPIELQMIEIKWESAFPQISHACRGSRTLDSVTVNCVRRASPVNA